jgi:hypothetical protein
MMPAQECMRHACTVLQPVPHLLLQGSQFRLLAQAGQRDLGELAPLLLLLLLLLPLLLLLLAAVVVYPVQQAVRSLR